MQFFIKRGQQIQGPFSREQIIGFVDAKKLNSADLIAQTPDGPFQQLSQVWASLSTTPQATQQPFAQAALTQVACNTCGSSIPADSRNCQFCKTPLSNAPVSQQSQAQFPATSPLPEQTPAPQDFYTQQLAAAQATENNQTKPTNKKKKKKSKNDAERKKLILLAGGAGGLLLLLLVGIILSYALAGPPPEYNANDLEETAKWVKSLEDTKALASSFKIDTNKGGMSGSRDDQKKLVAAIAEKLKPYLNTKVNWKVFLWADSRKPEKLDARRYLQFGNAYNVGSKGVNTAILFRVRGEVLHTEDAHDQSPKSSLQKNLYRFARMNNSSPDYIQHGETFNISATIAEIRVYANAYDFGKDDSAFKTSELEKLAAEAHMASTLLATTVDTEWAKLSKKRSALGKTLTSMGHPGAFVDIILKIDEDWSPEESIVDSKDRTFFKGGQKKSMMPKAKKAKRLVPKVEKLESEKETVNARPKRN